MNELIDARFFFSMRILFLSFTLSFPLSLVFGNPTVELSTQTCSQQPYSAPTGTGRAQSECVTL